MDWTVDGSSRTAEAFEITRIPPPSTGDGDCATAWLLARCPGIGGPRPAHAELHDDAIFFYFIPPGPISAGIGGLGPDAGDGPEPRRGAFSRVRTPRRLNLHLVHGIGFTIIGVGVPGAANCCIAVVSGRRRRDATRWPVKRIFNQFSIPCPRR